MQPGTSDPSPIPSDSSKSPRRARSVMAVGAAKGGRHEWPSTSLLGRLSGAAGADLLEQGTAMVYPKHRTLLREGDGGRHLLLLTRGVVKVTSRHEAGVDMLLGIRVAGDVVGEMAAFEDRPRCGTVVACGEVTARVIPLPDLERFLARRPEAMKPLMAMLSARLRTSNQRRIESRLYEAPVRLARILLELVRTHGLPIPGHGERRQEIGVTISQPELASLCGLALPTAEKVLATLSTTGLVERSYRRITVCDVPGLMTFAKVFPESPYWDGFPPPPAT
ncbi:Crp/Fnr family transcriptional regulator [Actinacidiphila alni]|nr:Crp/Fnr family transcriptional regulator [Actinacidiphila alni]